jgi:hypothetical protein
MKTLLNITTTLLLGLSLLSLAGCAAFEVTPGDVHQKLTHPLDGQLYVPDAANHRGELAVY